MAVGLREFKYLGDDRSKLYADFNDTVGSSTQWKVANMLFSYSTLGIYGPAFILQFIATFGVAVTFNVDYWQFAVARIKPAIDFLAFIFLVLSYDSAQSTSGVSADVIAALDDDIFTLTGTTALSLMALTMSSDGWLQA